MPVAVLQERQFVAFAIAQRRWRQQRRGVREVGVELERLDAAGLPAQRPGHPAELDHAGQQSDQRRDRQRPQRGAQIGVAADADGQCIAQFANQNHVDVAGLAALHLQARR